MFHDKNLVEKNLECLNCSNRYNKLKLLPCGSLICDCYKDSVVQTPSSFPVLECPFCKSMHQIPSSGFPIQKQISEQINTNAKMGGDHSRNKEVFNKLHSNMNSTIEMTSKLEGLIKNTETKIKTHFKEMKSSIERNFENSIDQIKKYKQELFDQIDCDESDFLMQNRTTRTSTRGWNDLKDFLLDTQEMLKSIKSELFLHDDIMEVGELGHEQVEIDKSMTKMNKLLEETNLINAKLEKFIKSFNEIFSNSVYDIRVYEEPALAALTKNRILNENIYSEILGRLTYDNLINCVIHNGKLDMNRLQTKYLPRILNYKDGFLQNCDQYTSKVLPLLNSKFVMCMHRYHETNLYDDHEIFLILFDYEIELEFQEQIRVDSSCNVLDITAFNETIFLLLYYECERSMVKIYNDCLQLKNTIKLDIFSNSLIFNQNRFFIISENQPFVHELDLNFKKIRNFGQNSNKFAQFYFEPKARVFIKFDKLYAVGASIRVFSLNDGSIINEFKLNDEYELVRSKQDPITAPDIKFNNCLFTVDNDEKLIITNLGEKIINIYDLNNSKEDCIKPLYKHVVTEIQKISSVSVTKGGYLMIHDQNDHRIYLY